MRAKHVVTALLLAFVAVSVVFLIMKERRPGTREAASPAETAAPAARTSAEGAREASPARTPSKRIVVYYFHGTRRCPTCRKLEEYTHAALAEAFADDLEAGTIVWRTIDTDEPGNGHYVKDYVLTTKSVILSAENGGKETRWENLPRIWELVGDRAAFISYIQDGVEAFREEE
jgi:hypothetical protein